MRASPRPNSSTPWPLNPSTGRASSPQTLYKPKFATEPPVDPEYDLALGDARLDIAVVTMQGDTAVAVRGPRKECVREFLHQHLLGIAPALRRPQDLDRDRWQALIGEQPLMRRRIIGVDEGLMALFQVSGSAGERTLIVIEPPLDIDMRLNPVQIAFPCGLTMVLWSISSRPQTASNASEVEAPPLSDTRYVGAPYRTQAV